MLSFLLGMLAFTAFSKCEPRASVAHPDLLDPSKASAKAPDSFEAKFTTTKGAFVIEVHRDWSPNGADRFYNLVKMGFYDDSRHLPRRRRLHVVQFGYSGDPAVSRAWMNATIPDDPAKQPNKKGFVTLDARCAYRDDEVLCDERTLARRQKNCTSTTSTTWTSTRGSGSPRPSVW